MTLTRAGQFVNVVTKQVENILDFNNGELTISISDSEYQKVLNHLQRVQTPFYVDKQNVQGQDLDEDGVRAL